MNRKVLFVLIFATGLSLTGYSQVQGVGSPEMTSPQNDGAKQTQQNNEVGEETVSTEQVYLNFRSAELRYRWELDAEAKKGNIGIIYGLPSKNFDNQMRHRKILEFRSARGDAQAMFYMGLLTSETAAWLRGPDKDPRADKEFEKAIGFYKKACNAGLSNGCWNVALMYADGTGLVKSGLAAAEWFYKAGTGYLKNDERERAMASLESIQEIDKAHPLAKKLNALIQQGAPK